MTSCCRLKAAFRSSARTRAVDTATMTATMRTNGREVKRAVRVRVIDLKCNTARAKIRGMMMLDDLMAWVVPDRDRCERAADDLRAEHPGATPEQLARRAIASARSWGVAAGGTTGAAANPLIMVPAAMADIAAMLRIEGQMAGTIAALLDPSSLLQAKTLHADV